MHVHVHVHSKNRKAEEYTVGRPIYYIYVINPEENRIMYAVLNAQDNEDDEDLYLHFSGCSS